MRLLFQFLVSISIRVKITERNFCRTIHITQMFFHFQFLSFYHKSDKPSLSLSADGAVPKANETRPPGGASAPPVRHRRLYSGITPPPGTNGSKVPFADRLVLVGGWVEMEIPR